MIRDLGIVKPGTLLYIPFHTFDSNDPSASVTLTGLATTDIEIYKDGSVTQRASDAGYALLDTDGIDFDATTGIHGISIDLADNTTAGFYAAGSQYWVVISSVTVDAATINFVLCTFRIGCPDAVLNTTIATLATQTSFTLTSGPAEDDALNGCIVYIHDVASAVQGGFAVVQDYTGATKTVTLAAGTTFTAAATDNIAVFPPALVPTVLGRTLAVESDGVAHADVKEILGVAQSATDLKDFADDGYDPATNKVQGVVLVDTLTTYTGNTVQTGDSFARIGAAGAGLTAIDLPNQTMDITGNLSGSVGSVTGAVGSVTAGVTLAASAIQAIWDALTSALTTVGSVGKLIVDNLNATISSRMPTTHLNATAGALDVVTTLTNKTGFALAAGGIGAGVIAAAELNAIADAILDRNMATGTDSGTDSTAVRTVRQALRLLRNKRGNLAGVLTVRKEDDVTASWTAAVTTAAGNPTDSIDPT